MADQPQPTSGDTVPCADCSKDARFSSWKFKKGKHATDPQLCQECWIEWKYPEGDWSLKCDSDSE